MGRSIESIFYSSERLYSVELSNWTIRLSWCNAHGNRFSYSNVVFLFEIFLFEFKSSLNSKQKFFPVVNRFFVLHLRRLTILSIHCSNNVKASLQDNDELNKNEWNISIEETKFLPETMWFIRNSSLSRRSTKRYGRSSYSKSNCSLVTVLAVVIERVWLFRWTSISPTPRTTLDERENSSFFASVWLVFHRTFVMSIDYFRYSSDYLEFEVDRLTLPV